MEANAKFIQRKFSWRKEIKESVLIFLLGGVVQLAFWLDVSNFQWYNFFLNFSYSGFFWVMLWKGSEHMVEFMDGIYSWFDHPVKRVLLSASGIVFYTFIVVYLLDFTYDFFVFKKGFFEAFEELNGAPLVTTMLINLGINTFMHGRGFLIEWRQASIDNERLKTEQVSAQYKSLKNQVNPHFLFNSLNALSSLVYEDQDKAVDFIRKLAQVYRYVLDSRDEEVVPVNDEMTFVKNFVFLQKIRFGDNLQVELQEGSPQHHVPPLAIQVLVENAIKHNVVSEKDPLSIKVTFEDQYCRVWNSLKEKKAKDSTGIGLDNLIERYHYLSNESVNVTKKDDYFEVDIPLLTLSE